MYVEGFIDFGEDVDELGQEQMFDQGLCATHLHALKFITAPSSSLTCAGYNRPHPIASVGQPQG